MCESVAYIKEGNSEKIYVRDVATLIAEDSKVILIDITGNKYTLLDTIVEYVDFIGHKIVLRKIR
ncbi:MAG: CooT family nickel-binding protein [Ignisphaera sp.]|nr:CooT family nickel-binding protein [Ignisphaera sp.]MCX8168271.1 CooT family nickel-binding protein [Ignisphaera sp.]MDW8086046.1 CooT family nickel-binding protein [Ignisphaera sp.]